MRERLIELLLADVSCGKDGHGDCSMCEYESAENECVKYLATRLADHLLANGVIVPPSQPGSEVFFAGLESGEILRGELISYSLDAKNLWFYCRYDYGLNYWHLHGDFGVKVFLTREEAEQALKRGVQT